MDTIRGVVRNGRIETDDPIRLPEGTELLIPLPELDSNDPELDSNDEDGWDDSRESIAAWLAWADSLEPLAFTDAERAAWEADMQIRKEWEKSHFDNYTAELRK